MQKPNTENGFQAQHADLLTRSFAQVMGRALHCDLSAKGLYHAPFPILSHNTDADPILTYGNLAAQKLWQMDWQTLTQMPSRLTAEPTHRDQRAQMFENMRKNGFIDNYAGVRISATGTRFEIRNAVIWTLTDAAGEKRGEAATFADYLFL